MANANSTSSNKFENAMDRACQLIDEHIQDNSQTQAPEPRQLAAMLPHLEFEAPKPAWQGGKSTNTEARKITSNLKNWTNRNLPGHAICEVAESLDTLFVRVWTEVDEALSALSSFKRILEKRAPDTLVARPGESCYILGDQHVTGLETAMMYLHRWQDRGGVSGNAAQVGRFEHPINELAATKKRLEAVSTILSQLTQRSGDAAENANDLLCAALDYLPPENGKARSMITAAIGLIDGMAENFYNETKRIDEFDPESEASTQKT